MKSSQKKISVAAYCRVSTDKDDQLMSLTAQQEFFEDYAKSNNFELLPLYADEGISGTKLKNRKAFNKMMADAEIGLFDVVYVKDISRFARNAVDFLTSIRKLKSMGIQCRFITSNLSTEDGEFTLGILALVAQEESANLSKRVKFGKEKNAKYGKVPNLVYGYNKTIGELFNLEINLEEAGIVNHIYDMYLNEGFGANKIAQILNAEGHRTKRGYKWSQNAVSRILQNQLYIGKIINCKEYIDDYLTGIRKKNVLENQYIIDRKDLAIIKQEDFEKTQKIMAHRKNAFKIKSERQSCKYPFSTLIKCECCGYSFRRITKTYKNIYSKWVCSGRNANGRGFCENHTTVDEQGLFNSIREYILSFILNKDKLVSKATTEFKAMYLKMDNIADERTLKDELSKLNKIKHKQLKMFEVDAITIDELRSRIEKINQSIRHYEQELDLLKGDSSFQFKMDQEIKQYCNINSILRFENFDNAILSKIINKIIVKKDGIIDVYINEIT